MKLAGGEDWKVGEEEGGGGEEGEKRGGEGGREWGREQKWREEGRRIEFH